jgi:hypothetical protein
VSATGFEPVTNGLKGQSPVCAAPIQCPACIIQSFGRLAKLVHWMRLFLLKWSQHLCIQWIFITLRMQLK